MKSGLSSQFKCHFLIHYNLSTYLGDGFLDSSALLDTVGCRQATMEQLCYSGDAIHIFVLLILLAVISLYVICHFKELDKLHTAHFSNCDGCAEVGWTLSESRDVAVETTPTRWARYEILKGKN